MKRMLLLTLCLFVLLSGCAVQEEIAETEPEISFRTGTGWDQFWNTEEGFAERVDDCVVPDKEAAVRIATAIYRESPIYTYAPQSVFYDEAEEVWVVEFYTPIPDSGPVATDQPVHAVAIRKADGRVLGIFKG